MRTEPKIKTTTRRSANSLDGEGEKTSGETSSELDDQSSEVGFTEGKEQSGDVGEETSDDGSESGEEIDEEGVDWRRKRDEEERKSVASSNRTSEWPTRKMRRTSKKERTEERSVPR